MARAKKPSGTTASAFAIDREKLRVALRRLTREPLLAILERAIEQLPPDRLAEVFNDYVSVDQLRPEPSATGGLLAAVKKFNEASRQGDYYEDFAVNSKNFMDKSHGTASWIEECNRLLRRCVAAADAGAHAEAREAFQLVFELLEYINRGEDGVIFFADEAGAWQVGVEWDVVLPAWFACLAATVSPDEYASSVVWVVDEFEGQARDRHLKNASAAATPAQRKALKSEATAGSR